MREAEKNRREKKQRYYRDRTVITRPPIRTGPAQSGRLLSEVLVPGHKPLDVMQRTIGDGQDEAEGTTSIVHRTWLSFPTSQCRPGGDGSVHNLEQIGIARAYYL